MENPQLSAAPAATSARPARPALPWWQHPAARVAGVTIGAGIVLLFTGGIAYQLGKQVAAHAQTSAADAPEGTIWTCSMHPQVRLPKPGKCPICFMDLTPAESQSDGNPLELVMTPEAVQLAQVETTPVERKFVSQTVHMVGKVDYDETRLANITSWVPGRLDRLYIDYTGVTVRKGDHLVEMYSPDLIVAQRELIQANTNYQKFGRERSDQLLATTLKSTEEKLRLLGLTPDQIEAIKQRGTPQDRITIYAPSGGVVVHKNATEGIYVQTGTRIYTIADLSQVWVFMDAYESDVPWLRYGQEVEFTVETYPGEVFSGRIAFIDPILDEKTRTVRVRVNVPNQDQRLKPGMFVRARVRSQVAEGGQVIDHALAGKWVSPHHPEIVRDEPGLCPICKIPLVPAEELGFVKADAGAEPPLVIPASAPLLTGKRAVVYVKVPDAKQPTFAGREVLLGNRAGDYYLVRHGLREGEQVVTQGNFNIDSALQIAARPSMMNPAELIAETGDPTSAGGVGKPLEIPAAFRVAISPVYHSYLAASTALAEDKLSLARTQLEQLLAAIKQVDTSVLDDAGRGRWKTFSDGIEVATMEAIDANDRKLTRERFSRLSRQMLATVQTFGHALETPVYQFHCAMALDNTGATWLQASDRIHNPYFGPAMDNCGETRATFMPAGPLEVPTAFLAELEPLYADYFKLQVALAADDAKLARQRILALESRLKQVNAASLGPRSKDVWASALRRISEALGKLPQQAKLDDLRKRFENLSVTMLGVADNFGNPRSEPLYKAWCPMAFGPRGAPWLQAGKQIHNPYMGAKMLTCGSIQRTFEPTAKTDDNTSTTSPPAAQPSADGPADPQDDKP